MEIKRKLLHSGKATYELFILDFTVAALKKISYSYLNSIFFQLTDYYCQCRLNTFIRYCIQILEKKSKIKASTKIIHFIGFLINAGACKFTSSHLKSSNRGEIIDFAESTCEFLMEKMD